MEAVEGRQVVELAGGEALSVDGRRIEVLATPGHASHHLAYMDAETKVLFAGDAAGLREPGSTDAAPYTPPPDIDLAAWRESLERMRAARPAALLLTHFGMFGDPGEHLDVFERRLMEWAEIAKPIAESELSLEEAGRDFVNRLGGTRHRVFEAISDPAHCGQGLVRYWRKLALPAGST
jgi:glyoxylase-like metal-dependent hydrolase (beta-lactamase superfamily II)